MPLFLLPYLYSQLVFSSATSYWTNETSEEEHSPSLPSPETIAQVLR
jgi:hypothetical protein